MTTRQWPCWLADDLRRDLLLITTPRPEHDDVCPYCVPADEADAYERANGELVQSQTKERSDAR